MPIRKERAAIQGTSSVSVALATSTAIWNSWALIAIEHEAEAQDARTRLAAKYSAGEDWGNETTQELHAAIVAITASSFAIDGFYGTVSPWIQVPQAVRAAWDTNGTARHARVFETLKRGFRIGGGVNRWPTEFKWLFSYRDANVHFEEIFRDESHIRHPVLGGVSWERAAYTTESSSRAVDLALEVLTTCVASPIAGSEQLADVTRRFGAVVEKYEELRLP